MTKDYVRLHEDIESLSDESIYKDVVPQLIKRAENVMYWNESHTLEYMMAKRLAEHLGTKQTLCHLRFKHIVSILEELES